jgi:hypothetical protein
MAKEEVVEDLYFEILMNENSLFLLEHLLLLLFLHQGKKVDVYDPYKEDSMKVVALEEEKPVEDDV